MASADHGPDDLLVIIPAFNEESALPEVLGGLNALSHLDVVVVDDGSHDRTSEVARQHGAAVVTLPYNLGIGGALRAGFNYAVRHGYQRAIQFDGDGQHQADQIHVLLNGLDSGADLVIGSRFKDNDGHYQVSRTRGLAMGLLRRIVRRATRYDFTDTSSGFRAFSRPMLDYFAVEYPAEYMESVEALLLAHRRGFKVVEVGVTMKERAGGTASNRNFKLVYHFARLLLVVVASPKGARS